MQDMANIAQVMKVEAETVESASISAAAAAAAEVGGSKRSEEGGRSSYWGMIYQVYLDRQVCGPADLLLQFPPITTVAAAWI